MYYTGFRLGHTNTYYTPTSTLIGEYVAPDKYMSMELPSHKESVDTDCFIPGKYRVNPYSVGQSSISDMCGSCKGTNTKYPYRMEQFAEGPIHLDSLRKVSTASVPNVSYLRDQALQTAYSRVANAELATGESIGELRETIDMIRHPLKELRDFLDISNIKHLDNLVKKDALTLGSKLADKAASTWMEARYGIRPLVMLLRDAIEKAQEVKDRNFNKNTIRSVHCTRTKEYNSSYTCEATRANDVPQLRHQYSIVDKFKVNASVQYLQDCPLTTLQEYGLSPEFLPETAWELTTRSFVVDWIFSVGPWLGSLRFNPIISLLGNTVGVRHSREAKAVLCESRFWKYISGYDRPWIPTECAATYTVEEYDRVVNAGIPGLPIFTHGDVIDLFKAVDSCAMMWQSLIQPHRR